MVKGCLAVYPEKGEPKKIDWSYYYTRLVPLLNSHPDIEMEFCGLSDKDNFRFLHDYDFVFMYLLPVDKVGKYWWYEIPELVRPYCKKIILQFDYEGIMYDLPPFIRDMINNNVDALCYNSPNAGERWKVKVPKFPFMMLQPVEELEKMITPTKTWFNGVGILWHAGTGCNINHSLGLCANKNWNMKVYTAWLGMEKHSLESYCRQIIGNYENVEFYPFMKYKEFLKELSTWRVALEDNENYYGFSRLSYECATLRIPVVGSSNSMGCNLAYPFTTTNPRNVQLQTQLIKRLFNDKEFYSKVTDYAYSAMKTYFSNDECLRKLIYILKHIGVNV